jgi:hypothetical protein
VIGLNGSLTYQFTVTSYNAVGDNSDNAADQIRPGASQTITFTGSSEAHSAKTISLNAVSSVGLPITYSIVSETATYTASGRHVCTLSDPAVGLIQIDLAGTCKIRASQNGLDANGNETVYYSTTIDADFTVTPSDPSQVPWQSAISGDRFVTVNWNASLDDGGAPSLTYKIKYVKHSEFNDASKYSTPVDIAAGIFTKQFTSLINGVTYDFLIQTINAAGLTSLYE